MNEENITNCEWTYTFSREKLFWLIGEFAIYLMINTCASVMQFATKITNGIIFINQNLYFYSQEESQKETIKL